MLYDICSLMKRDIYSWLWLGLLCLKALEDLTQEPSKAAGLDLNSGDNDGGIHAVNGDIDLQCIRKSLQF